MRRSFLFAVIAVSVLSSSPASAKVPPFSVELGTGTATVGAPVQIRVRFWNDARHTEPASWPDIERLGELFWFYPTDDADAATPVDARLVRPGEYAAAVTPTRPGAWTLCVWSVGCDEKPKHGYPGRIELTVGSETRPVAGSPPADERPQALLLVAIPILFGSIFIGPRLLAPRRTHA